MHTIFKYLLSGCMIALAVCVSSCDPSSDSAASGPTNKVLAYKSFRVAFKNLKERLTIEQTDSAQRNEEVFVPDLYNWKTLRPSLWKTDTNASRLFYDSSATYTENQYFIRYGKSASLWLTQDS